MIKSKLKRIGEPVIYNEKVYRIVEINDDFTYDIEPIISLCRINQQKNQIIKNVQDSQLK